MKLRRQTQAMGRVTALDSRSRNGWGKKIADWLPPGSLSANSGIEAN